jgi:hypothetical protein
MAYLGNDLATSQFFQPNGLDAVSRTIDSKLKESVSVKDFGAVGDGVADDRTAIQSALNAAAVNGGVVLFPPGNYKVTATATINGNISHFGLIEKDNISIIGYGATITSTATASTYLFNFDGCRNISVEGLTIAGQFSRTGSTINTTSIGAFYFTSSNRDSNTISIRNVRATNCYFFLITFGSSPFTYRVRDLSVQNCLLISGYYGLNFQNNGDNFTASGFRATQVVRTYFPYGVDSHDVNYISLNGDVFTDCLIKAYDRDTTNIKVKARISGNTSADAKCTIESQHPPATQPTPATLSNIQVDFDDRNSTGAKSLRFAYFQNSTETATSTNNLFNNIRITGYSRNDFDIAVVQTDTGRLDISTLEGLVTGEIWNEKGFYYLPSPLDATADPDKMIRGLQSYSANTSAPNPPGGADNYAGLSFGSEYGTIQLAQGTGKLNLYGRIKRGISAWTAWAVFPDQESGNWSPDLRFGGGATGMAGTQTGKYVRMGNLVYVWCEIILTAKGSSTGGSVIQGLPFTVGNSQWTPLQVLFYSGGASLASPTGFANAGTANLELAQQGAAGINSFSDANFTNTSRLWVSCTYRIDTF